jgi:hypothetical protein
MQRATDSRHAKFDVDTLAGYFEPVTPHLIGQQLQLMPQRLLRDLPDVAGGIAEARGSDTPRAIHRAVQQLDSPLGQLGAHRIHVVDVDRELEAGARVGAGDLGRPDEVGRLSHLQEVDQRVPEVEHGRVGVLEMDRQAEDLLVELLRRGQVLDEQGDVWGWP